MNLYDTLNQLKTKVHCSEMTAATALDTLYQAAMNLIQMPDRGAVLDSLEQEAVETEVAPVDDDPIDPDDLMNG